ncbi:mediator of RNA polymerase II transcription subunit 15-like isoform X2 [Pocillopora verrucosa]|uniref:mediator of RNA polymerase II transcription subunit 15-like isoform X2 n=1 Tax=Pocillopora verrucosa TaxID=203993 RepID=UPI002797969E|nr:mediator of RNA polymerase II transcription subunit 15-like isoform X2 [Pocillopora verrucosa]
MASTEDWRSPAYRQKVILQIEEAVKRSGNPNMMMSNPSDMENQLFLKAETRANYLLYVAHVLVYIRDKRVDMSVEDLMNNRA